MRSYEQPAGAVSWSQAVSVCITVGGRLLVIYRLEALGYCIPFVHGPGLSDVRRRGAPVIPRYRSRGGKGRKCRLGGPEWILGSHIAEYGCVDIWTMLPWLLQASDHHRKKVGRRTQPSHVFLRVDWRSSYLYCRPFPVPIKVTRWTSFWAAPGGLSSYPRSAGSTVYF